MRPERFLYKIFLLGTPLLLCFVAVNYFGDASLLFEADYEQKMADILLDDGMVENFYDFDERVFQKAVIFQQDEVPQMAIFGSSRGMLIRTSTFDSTYTLMNHSVSGASVEDQIALFQSYKHAGALPKKVLLTFEPWTLNANNEQERWKGIREEYTSFFEPSEYSAPGIPWGKYAQLLSASYFQASLHQLIAGEGSRDPKRAKDRFNETNTKLPDGSLVYNDEYRLATPVEIEKKVREYMSGDIYSIEGFDALDASLQLQYTQLLDSMEQDGIDVLLYLEPYHPRMWREAKANYPKVLAAEEWIRSLAKERALPLVGSFDPGTLDLDSTAFYDAMHLKEWAVEDLFQDFKTGE